MDLFESVNLGLKPKTIYEVDQPNIERKQNGIDLLKATLTK